MNAAVMFSSASDEWATPQAVFDALDAEFHFGLDAAATQANAKCRDFLGSDSKSARRDALTCDWGAVTAQVATEAWMITRPAVWLNPPYSRCAEFIAKAAAEAQSGETVVCLVPSRTDTRWWHRYVWDVERHQPRAGVEVRFLPGRLKFGDSKNSAPFPSVVIVFRPQGAA